MRRRRLQVLAILCLQLLPSLASGERLPIRTYTTAEGLAHNYVGRIVRDSRGFLWFATNDGLSRFDGYGFANYSVEQGLPHRIVRDLLESRSGELWVATFGGLVRFRPDGIPEARVVSANDEPDILPMFAVITPADTDPRARVIISLLESSDGTIWCGTRKGLFRLERAGGRFELQPVDIGIRQDDVEGLYVNDLLEDHHGTLWAATPHGLYRRWPDGAVARYGKRDGLPDEFIHDLLQDRHKRLWIATRYSSFFRLVVDASSKPPLVADHYPYPHRFATTWVDQLRESSDGRFWASTSVGLVEFLAEPAGGASPFIAYTRANGLSHQEVTALQEDASGNLWVGTRTSGAMKLARSGFVTFGQSEGLAAAGAILEDSTGQLYVRGSVFPPPVASNETAGATSHLISMLGRFDGRRFTWFNPGPPFGWGWVAHQCMLRTRSGEWWLAGTPGLFRYAALPDLMAIRTAKPIRIFTRQDGLPAEQVYRIFEDSRHDVWFSVVSPGSHGLFRWERATDTLHDLSEAPQLPSRQEEQARPFGEDTHGNVWIGFNSGAARYRHGSFAFFTQRDGLPGGSIVDIHTDGAGRLWLASSQGGLVRVEHPERDRPLFRAYTTAQGLSGNSIEAIVADRHGRIYAATGRGIDQFDPETGRIRHFSAEDGLAPGTVLHAFRDRTGALWFGTQNGLSRFTPRPAEPWRPPSITITGLTVAGTVRPVSAVGETDTTLPDLSPGGNQLQIDFVSLRFAPGERLRYQYRLDGADKEWGEPTTRQTVSYANLSPGRYRFLVRVVNADGAVSPNPAVVSFTVLPPFWQRWWFLSLAALAVASAVFVLHRYRLSRVLELERVRTRIATDLHDDIGANLTRITILSEVVRQQPHGGDGRLDATLSSIATIARESVTSMADIVWAISPERDTLSEVVRRMRHHAEEVFDPRGVALELDLPDSTQPMKLGVNVRRDLYLIFKEAVSNAARHSGCTRVSIVLGVIGSRLVLEISDDGIGFDSAAERDGHGLRSMQHRAERLGASLEVQTAPRGGTTVTLSMPVDTRAPAALPG